MTNPLNTTPRPSKFISWCRLLRVPNLFTVPGDPIVGFVLAGLIPPHEAMGGAIWPPVVAALLLYAAGLLANDYIALAEDRRDRPARPQPAGQVRPATALAVALALTGLGVGAAALRGLVPAGVAAALAGCLWGYDAGLKRVRVLGPGVMGLCRGLSLLLGAACCAPDAVSDVRILAPAGALAAYIAAVTLVAANETRVTSLRFLRWGPALAMILLVVAVFLSTCGALMSLPAYGQDDLAVVTIALLILAAGASLAAAERLRGVPPTATVQRTVGQLIRNLLLVHAAVAGVMGFPYWLIGVAFLAAWPASAMLARRFYAS